MRNVWPELVFFNISFLNSKRSFLSEQSQQPLRPAWLRPSQKTWKQKIEKWFKQNVWFVNCFKVLPTPQFNVLCLFLDIKYALPFRNNVSIFLNGICIDHDFLYWLIVCRVTGPLVRQVGISMITHVEFKASDYINNWH